MSTRNKRRCGFGDSSDNESIQPDEAAMEFERELSKLSQWAEDAAETALLKIERRTNSRTSSKVSSKKYCRSMAVARKSPEGV